MEVEANIGREIIIEYKQQPAHVFPFLERREAVSWETERNISRTFEEKMFTWLTSSNNMCSPQSLIVLSIKHIQNCTWNHLGIFAVISHLSYQFSIPEERYKARNEQMHELPIQMVFRIVARFCCSRDSFERTCEGWWSSNKNWYSSCRKPVSV